MRDCIYTFWFDNDDEEYTEFRRQCYTDLKSYKDRTIEYYRNYAKSIGVSYEHIDNYKTPETLIQGPSKFARETYSKFYIAEDLLKTYDRVFYVDLDLVFIKDINPFEVDTFPFITHTPKSENPEKVAFKRYKKVFGEDIDNWLSTQIIGMDRTVDFDMINDIQHTNEFVKLYMRENENLYPTSESWIVYLHYHHGLHFNPTLLRRDDHFFHPTYNKLEILEYL